jgi:hypothetical protein
MSTRESMRLSAKAAANQTGGDFPGLDVENDVLDRAASTVWRRLQAAGWIPDRTVVTLTANGAQSYNVATDVHSVLSVSRVDGTMRVPLTRLKPEQESDYRNFSGGQASAFLLTGGATSALAITLLPVPTSGTYEVVYTKRFPGFLADSDPWYGPDGSDELIILTAAIDFTAMEYGDISFLQKRLDDRWGEVLQAAEWLNAQGVQTVRDARTMDSLSPLIRAFNYNAFSSDLT